MKLTTKITVACAVLAATSGAFAQKAGDNIVSVGIASINPDTSLGKLTSTSSDATTAGYFTGKLANATATVGSETTVSVGWLHMYTDNMGVELTLGLPPEVTQDLYSPATGNHPGAAKIKIWTPTVVGKYFFNTPADKWRPYIGFGVSQVSFHNVKVNTADQTVNALGSTSASFSSSLTPVYTLGTIYNIDEKWSVSAAVAYLPIKTTATFNGPGATAPVNYPVTTTGEAKLNTTDYVIRLGYRF